MESQTAWFFLDERVPESEVVVPIRSSHGLAMAVSPTATVEELINALNETTRFVLGVGLAHLGHMEKPPDEAREE
ncbi:hypothetical protein [Streptomyces longwoodensis]|uniref:hypothetical protein n=1 Tax=Streptomyces longwoodensis TaxID=68231 RepID=UPI0033C8B470